MGLEPRDRALLYNINLTDGIGFKKLPAENNIPRKWRIKIQETVNAIKKRKKGQR